MTSFSVKIIWGKIKQSLPLTLLVFIPTIILLLVLGIISLVNDISPDRFLTDPATLMDFEPYIGLVSNLGIILWASSVAICFFTFATLRGKGKYPNISNLALFFGIFTLILLLDDLFMIHEWISRYSSEYVVFAIYIVIILFLLFKFRGAILETDYLFLIYALLFFGLSLVIDALDNYEFLNNIPFWRGGRPLLEDGCKFLGIANWLTYFARVGYTSLISTDQPQ